MANRSQSKPMRDLMQAGNSAAEAAKILRSQHSGKGNDMAKAAEATKDNFHKIKPDPVAGWKECPACKGWVKGARTGKCPSCKHVFVAKEKTETTSKTTAAKGASYVESTALAVLKAGGLDKLRSVIQQFKNDPATDFITSCGGVEGASKALDQLEQELKL